MGFVIQTLIGRKRRSTAAATVLALALVLLATTADTGSAAGTPPRKLPTPELPLPPASGNGPVGGQINPPGQRGQGGPVVNVSVKTGNQSETTIAINPTNPDNVVVFSNEASAAAIFRAYSFDGGTTWTRGDIAPGACCDGQAVFDSFGNLFLVDIGPSDVDVLMSTDGGVTFPTTIHMGAGSPDQPSIAAGAGSLWVDWNESGSMVARGAPVSGLGGLGAFGARQNIPSAGGSFGGIAVGPGPNGGKVMVVYQAPYGDQGPSTIYVNEDADGLGPGGFGSRITVCQTNVGGFDYIPAQNRRSIDAESGLVWDRTGGPFNNRIYLIYTDETVNENNDTDIEVRTSDDDGHTWTAPVRVNDDPAQPIRSQFLPYIALDPTTGVVAAGWHDCRRDDGLTHGTNNVPNDDAEYYASFSVDGGATWAPNFRLSDGFSNAQASGNGIDFGDFVGTTAYAGKFRPAWADNSNSTGDNPDGTNHRLDIYSAPLPLLDPNSAVGSPSGRRVDPASIPGSPVLLAPAPNPTSGQFTLSYSLPAAGDVRLTLHDVSGREVARLAEGAQSAGWHTVALSGAKGEGLAAGTFFVRLTQSGRSQVEKVVVIR